MNNKKISIIIRTKNEERWIAQVLRGVFSQRDSNFEVIIVDNESTDNTLSKVKQFNIEKIIKCERYRPGKALNMGIKEAGGEYIVSLSGHCIPANEEWLARLLDNFNPDFAIGFEENGLTSCQDKACEQKNRRRIRCNTARTLLRAQRSHGKKLETFYQNPIANSGFNVPEIAGVYGRQQPLSFTADADKRDLALVFGLDRKVQIKDSFFHNANSMILKKVWADIPFDETVTNIEDRIWAQEALRQGYRIAYEPEAAVFHYHGIHHNGNVERCANVVRILENMSEDYGQGNVDMEKMNVVALIPVRGAAQYLDKKPLLAYTIQRALESKYIKRTIVAADNPETASLAKELKAEAPFLRDACFSQEYIDLGKVLQYSLEEIEKRNIFPDIVVSLEATFPFRPPGLLDKMILRLVQGGFDTVIAARLENKSIWKEKEGSIVQIDEGMTPRQFKPPAFIGLKGVGCVTHPEFIRTGDPLGKKIGIYEVHNPFAHIEVRSKEDFHLASLLMDSWFR